MCDLDRARHRQLISVPLNLVWRGSKARAKSLTCVWWWVLALAGLGLEHPHVDFACCCSASSQGSGWVPSASIQRKTEREGVAKAVIFYGQLSEVRQCYFLILLICSEEKASSHLKGPEIRLYHLIGGMSTNLQ